MKKCIDFLLEERENKFLDGFVDNPMMLYHELLGTDEEAFVRCSRGADNVFNVAYTLGEIAAAPVTIPLAIAYFSKKTAMYCFEKKKTNDLDCMCI